MAPGAPEAAMKPGGGVDQRALFERVREHLLQFADVPEHRPCGDSSCIFCKKVEGKRVFDILKSLGRYLRTVTPDPAGTSRPQ